MMYDAKFSFGMDLKLEEVYSLICRIESELDGSVSMASAEFDGVNYEMSLCANFDYAVTRPKAVKEWANHIGIYVEIDVE